jgi:cold-inducible RNA-binding protein
MPEYYLFPAHWGYTKMGKKIFVGNLPFSMGEAELRELFEQKGAVDSATVMRDFNTGRSRGFAFVEMTSEEEAVKAIEELNGYSIDGRNLTVNEAKPKVERRGGFGQKKGGGRGGRNRESRW